jgi:hypothetical protein
MVTVLLSVAHAVGCLYLFLVFASLLQQVVPVLLGLLLGCFWLCGIAPGSHAMTAAVQLLCTSHTASNPMRVCSMGSCAAHFY